MDFVASKDEGMIPYVLSQILDTCINGVTLSDPDQEDNPIVYANEVFELITGYSNSEIIGRNCRFLQGDDRDQQGLEVIRNKRVFVLVMRFGTSQSPKRTRSLTAY